jgi:predicted AlkP superfamily phosphohydrolase/phosphomutase/tetratricopeptide (TPR) repeat protein
VTLPAGSSVCSATTGTTTQEGASVEISFRVSIDVTRADPATLRDLVRGVESEQGLCAAVAREVGRAVRESAVAGEKSSTESVARRLVGLGIDPGTLNLGPAHSPAPLSNPLRAVYTSPPWPITVIGVDSADWDLLEPLMEAGALPHLRALRDRGAWGTLRSMTPTLSPILWTTVATGRLPEDHNVLDFLMNDPSTGQEVPISRLFRKVKTLWNIASDLDISNMTVGWWATWPAERVTGQMVTDRVAYSLFDIPVGSPLFGATYPESLFEEIRDLLVPEESITYEDLRAIADVPQAEFDRARAGLDTPGGYKDPISHLIKILASTQSYHRIALHLLTRHHPKLGLVYFEGLDEVNHRFAHFMPPEMGLVRGTPPALLSAYKDAVLSFYRFQDRLIGDLVEASGDDAIIMVVSDHGFANGQERPTDIPPDIEGKPGRWHTLDGVIIAAGPPIRAGHVTSKMNLLDVTPTILALMGLPAAADMPGRAITELIDPQAGPRVAQVPVPSYDALGEPLQTGTAAFESTQDPEVVSKLQALGYIQSGASAQQSGTPTYHINAGRIFLEKHDLDRAEAEFSQAREKAPRFDQALLGLAQVKVMRGRPDEAIPLLEEAIRAARDPMPEALTRAASIYVKAGLHQRGLEFLGSLHLQGRHEAYRLAAMGKLEESRGNLAEAVTAYKEAVRIDPSVEPALAGLYTVMTRQGALDDLAAALKESLGVESVRLSVRVSNWLALTLERQGRRTQARSVLAVALKASPDDVQTLTNLGSMLVTDDLAADGLPMLERAHVRRPKSLELVVDLIVAHGKLGNLLKAADLFHEAEASTRAPDIKHLYNAYAYACFLNGAMRDAAAYINRSLEIDPGQESARRLEQEIVKKVGP